jgi:hypothetical protein
MSSTEAFNSNEWLHEHQCIELAGKEFLDHCDKRKNKGYQNRWELVDKPGINYYSFYQDSDPCFPIKLQFNKADPYTMTAYLATYKLTINQARQFWTELVIGGYS